MSRDHQIQPRNKGNSPCPPLAAARLMLPALQQQTTREADDRSKLKRARVPRDETQGSFYERDNNRFGN